MKPKQIYDNVFSQEEIDLAFEAVLKLTRKSLKLSPILETLVFLIAFMQASEDANIDFRGVMKALGNGKAIDEILIRKIQ